jgi:drug/metabolite transporter (DMT)-like permease
MDNRAAYGLFLLTTLFWGANAVAGKLAVGEISPMLLTALRWFFAVCILLGVGLGELRRDWHNIKAHLPLLFAYGALGFAGFNIALYSALNHTSAINVTIEQAGMPLVVFLANFLLFRQKANWAQLIGFGLTLIGVALTASHGNLFRLGELEINRGDAIMLLAVLLYGGYTVALRFKPKLHWKSLMIVMGLSAFVTALPFAAWEYLAGSAIVPGIKGVTIAAYTAIFPAILAQVFYMKGVDALGPNRAGLFINLVPIWGTALAIIILGEDFQPYHALALVLVLGGIGLSERSVRRA